jgi:hypothetical protein
MIIFLPLLICLIGLLMYFLSANAKVCEIGRLMFWVGLLSFLVVYRGEPISVK